MVFLSIPKHRLLDWFTHSATNRNQRQSDGPCHHRSYYMRLFFQALLPHGVVDPGSPPPVTPACLIQAMWHPLPSIHALVAWAVVAGWWKDGQVQYSNTYFTFICYIGLSSGTHTLQALDLLFYVSSCVVLCGHLVHLLVIGFLMHFVRLAWEVANWRHDRIIPRSPLVLANCRVCRYTKQRVCPAR